MKQEKSSELKATTVRLLRSWGKGEQAGGMADRLLQNIQVVVRLRLKGGYVGKDCYYCFYNDGGEMYMR